MIELLAALPAAVLMLWLGSIEWRLRNMHNRQSKHMDSSDIKEMIDIKNETLKSKQQDLKEDIVRLESKIDKLLELTCRKP